MAGVLPARRRQQIKAQENDDCTEITDQHEFSEGVDDIKEKVNVDDIGEHDIEKSGLKGESEDNSRLGDAWKTFGMQTEAGKLLAGLYKRSKPPQINYPPVSVQPLSEKNRPAFVPAGGRPDVDPREKSTKEASILVPRPAMKQYRHFAPIELREGLGKKHESDIKPALEKLEREVLSQKPTGKKALYTESNKRMLQNQFEYKGGKSLPSGLSEAKITGES